LSLEPYGARKDLVILDGRVLYLLIQQACLHVWLARRTAAGNEVGAVRSMCPHGTEQSVAKAVSNLRYLITRLMVVSVIVNLAGTKLMAESMTFKPSQNLHHRTLSKALFLYRL
jgi:hypothetical protein